MGNDPKGADRPLAGVVEGDDQAFEDLGAVAEALEARFGPAKSTAIVWRPKSQTPVAGDQAASLFKLIDALDDDDDVQNVFGNYALSDEELERLAG